MTADLPSDVRDGAAQAARDARQKYDNEHLSCNDHVRMLNVVDAVVAVVAPEIARPLQARIEELTAALTTVVDKNDLGCSGGCAEYYGAKYPGNWCGACVARAGWMFGANCWKPWSTTNRAG